MQDPVWAVLSLMQPQIVTVMLTGQADEAAIERARQQANLYACLRKPWTEEDLKQVISSALSGQN